MSSVLVLCACMYDELATMNSLRVAESRMHAKSTPMKAVSEEADHLGQSPSATFLASRAPLAKNVLPQGANKKVFQVSCFGCGVRATTLFRFYACE